MIKLFDKPFWNSIRHENPFVFNEFVQPAQLPRKSAPDDADCLVSGWGDVWPGYLRRYTGSDTLRHVTVPSMPGQDCAGYFPKDHYLALNTTRMFCLGLDEGGKGLVVVRESFDSTTWCGPHPSNKIRPSIKIRVMEMREAQYSAMIVIHGKKDVMANSKALSVGE